MEQITPEIPRQKMNIIDILLLLLALMLLLEFDRALHPRAIGIDLYQYWGIGKVIRETDGKIRNPYTEYQNFNRTLIKIAENTDDPAHQSVAEFRKDLELQGTPFSYFMFSWLPSEYNLTRVIYRYLQMGLFILTVSVLLQWAGYPWWRSLLTALLLLQVYYPMFSELGVGNFNTTLMAGLAGSIFIAGKLSSRPANDNGSVSTLFMAVFLLTWVGTLSLMKPPLIAVVIAFQLFLLARFGIKRFMQANLLSIISVGLIAALPAIRFHSLSIWLEWFHYFRGGNLDMFSLPIRKGNLSLPLYISNMLHIPLSVGTVLIAALLFFSFVLKPIITGTGVKRIRDQLADPHFALALGVVATLGLFPLTWVHYYLLLLVPALALLHPRHQATEASKLSILSILLATPNIPDMVPYTVMLSWIPLWLAALTIQPDRNRCDG